METHQTRHASLIGISWMPPLFDGDASYPATLTLIRMSVRGLSASPVAMSCILPTTSIPSTTSPKTVYCPSRNGVPPDVVYAARCSSVNPTQPFSLQIFFVSVMRRSCNACNPAWSRFSSGRLSEPCSCLPDC